MFSIWSTVVMTCSRKATSEISRLFLAMRMKRVLGRAETLQQVLRDSELEVGVDLRSDQGRGAVGGDVSVVESSGESCAPLKSLGVPEVGGVSVLSEDW